MDTEIDIKEEPATWDDPDCHPKTEVHPSSFEEVNMTRFPSGCDSFIQSSPCSEVSHHVSSNSVMKEWETRDIMKDPLDLESVSLTCETFVSNLSSSEESYHVVSDVVKEEWGWTRIKEDSLGMESASLTCETFDPTSTYSKVSHHEVSDVVKEEWGWTRIKEDPLDINSESLTFNTLVPTYSSTLVPVTFGVIKKEVESKNIEETTSENVTPQQMGDAFVPYSPCSEISPAVPLDMTKERCDLKIEEKPIEIFTYPEDFPYRSTSTEEDHPPVSVHLCAGCFRGYSRPFHLERHELFCNSLKESNDKNTKRTATGQDVTLQETIIMSGATLMPMSGEVADVPRKKKKTSKSNLLCKDCGKVFSGSCCIRENVSGGECGTEVNSSSIANRRVLNHRKDSSFKCDICEARFTEKQTLAKHMRSHSRERSFACAFCTMRFSTKGNLIRHTRIHTGEKPFACTVLDCVARFSTKGNLTQHLKRHTKEKSFACTVLDCVARFSTKGNLTQHLKRHTKEKSFACTVLDCVARFSSISNLTYHLQEHTGDKPFTCPLCPLTFFYKSNLTMHTMTHTGVKPFVCTVTGCDTRFSSRTGLANHMRTHTGIKSYVYTLYPSRFAMMSSLAQHTRTHHPA